MDLPYVEEASLAIDGRADELAWAEALVVEDWTVYWPAPGGRPQVHAVARMFCDQEAFYLHYEVIDPEPERVQARFTRRDDVWGDDLVGVYLDPSGEAQRGYLFFANAYGVQADATRMAGFDDEFSWDGQWSSQGELTERGFQVEMAVPWRSVRHPAELQQVGISLLRMTARSGERASWPVRDPDISGILVQENLLRGPGAVQQGWGLSLTPSLTWGWTDQGAAQDRWGAWGLAPGLTARIDPVPAVAGLLTVNPDFSQVESDAYQLDVNRRYALYYEEKRPFFLEGREWFEGSYGELIYTRSMNMPRYGARTTVEADGWTVAGLHVMDGAPADTVSEGGGWGEAELGPEDQRLAAFGSALRLRRAVGQDSYLGLLYSDKTVPGSGVANRVAAADTRLRLADAWELEGALLGSSTSYAGGSSELAPAGALALEHEGRHWLAGASTVLVPEDFRAENGYITRADFWEVAGWGGYRFYPGDALKQLRLLPFDVEAAWQPSDGRLRNLEVEPGLLALFSNAQRAALEVSREHELYEDVMLIYHQVEGVWMGPLTSWLRLGLGFEAGQGPYYDEQLVGIGGTVWGWLQLLPGRRTALSLEGTWERLDDQGEILYAGWVGRTNLELFASRQLWMRLVADRSSLDQLWSGETLLAWEASPGRAFYLGGALEQEQGEAASWQLFTKCSWQLRPTREEGAR